MRFVTNLAIDEENLPSSRVNITVKFQSEDEDETSVKLKS